MHVVIFYTVTFLLAMVNIWVFLSTRLKQDNIYYPLMLVIMAVSNAGYWTLSRAQTVEGAIIANRLCYLGGCFLMTFMFLCVLDLCNIQVSAWVHLLLNGICMLLYGIVLSMGITTWYYKTQDIVIENGYTRIVRTTGPLYPLFSIHMTIYVVAIILVIFWTMLNDSTSSRKNLIYILLMVVITTALYFSKKFLGYDFNLVPLAYAIDGIILLVLRQRIALYDVSSTVAQSLTKQDMYGYITFDRKKAFLACDNTARNFFPEFNKLHVDYALPYNTILFEHIHEWIDELDETQQVVVHFEHRDDREFKCTTNYIFHGSPENQNILGYMIEFFDVTDERNYLSLVENYNEELKNNVANETAHVREIQNKMILGMANIIENRDNSTGGHVKRTSKCIEIIVEELRARDTEEIYTDKFCSALIKAAPMHDIGKIAVPDAILQKPGKFTLEEFEQMQEHAAKGAELLNTLLEDVEDEYFIAIAQNMAHYHHERWNGTGYPEQLKGEQIPLEARIMALADVYDALVSKRCYKEKMSFVDASNVIRAGMGSQFDPSFADVFESCREKLEAYYTENT